MSEAVTQGQSFQATRGLMWGTQAPTDTHWQSQLLPDVAIRGWVSGNRGPPPHRFTTIDTGKDIITPLGVRSGSQLYPDTLGHPYIPSSVERVVMLRKGVRAQWSPHPLVWRKKGPCELSPQEYLGGCWERVA